MHLDLKGRSQRQRQYFRNPWKLCEFDKGVSKGIKRVCSSIVRLLAVRLQLHPSFGQTSKANSC